MPARYYSCLVLLLLLLLCYLQFHFSSGIGGGGVCISKGGHFPPFSSEGKPPRRVAPGWNELTFCRVFRKKTCCDVAQAHAALLSIRRLSSTGEASPECLHLWELLECSICDPLVGVQPGTPLLCSTFCDKVYAACADAYFSMNSKTRGLVPCGANDFVCGRGNKWASNGSELCQAAGFSVQPLDDDDDDDTYTGIGKESCYGGKVGLDSVVESWKTSRFEFPRESKKLGFLEEFKKWVSELSYKEMVSWAVGGMVLTAGLFFLRMQKSHHQRQLVGTNQKRARNHLGGRKKGKNWHNQAATRRFNKHG